MLEKGGFLLTCTCAYLGELAAIINAFGLLHKPNSFRTAAHVAARYCYPPAHPRTVCQNFCKDNELVELIISDLIKKDKHNRNQ